MKKTLISAVVATFASTMAMAQTATDQIINDLTGQGFERIEIDNGDGQIKVEAIRGRQKLEVVYDRATGSILKQEVKRVRAGDDTRPGVEIRDRNHDFVDASRSADDNRSVAATGAAATTANVSTRSTDTNEIVTDLQDQGFSRIEVKHGPSQTKVEAVRGTEKVETVFDRATGDVIKQEVDTVSAGDDTRPGVEVKNRDRDFVDASGSDDSANDDSSDSRDDHNGQSDDHSHNGASDDDSGNGSDDSSDHDSGDDHGSDRGSNDDTGSDHDSSDDHGSDRGSSDDHGSDHNRSDDHGGDNDSSDDHGSDHDSNDDHGNDDDSSDNDD